MKESGKFAVPAEGRPLMPAGAEPMFWSFGDRAQALGINMRGNVTRVANTRLSHILLEWAHEQSPQDQHALKELIFQGYYTNDIFLGLDNLVVMAGQVGYDMDAARAHLESGEGEAAMKRKSDTFKAQGVNGIPFIMMGETETFSGAQDPRKFAQALRRAAK